MPNIIINNYCNQSCSYCFANENMQDISLQKNMTILTFLKILKFLKINRIKEVRILGGEPLLFPNIRKFLKIANKGGFKIIIFSNINIDNYKLKEIFSGLNGIRINCNINDKNFYGNKELVNLGKNLNTLNKLGLNTIIGYNIIQINKKPTFIFNFAKKYNIKAINLKITNSSLGNNLLMDNSSRKFGIYLFEIIKKYHKNFFIEFSCGLDKKIFTKIELEYIKNNTNILPKFGCNGNMGKFDINTNGDIFKCYPLKILFNNKININNILKQKIDYKYILKIINKGNITNGECSSNKKIKNIIL